MASNPNVNKVEYAGNTLIDLTNDTVTAADVISSKWVHLPSGARVQGTCTYNSDTSSDTVTQADVLSGKTVHLSDGTKVTGSCPYDSKTTDANATAAEIIRNKTAYVNKTKLTGTLDIYTTYVSSSNPSGGNDGDIWIVTG